MENEKQMSFEQAMEQLELVLQRMDRGDLSLDESIQSFRDGLEYIKICQQKLEAAEGVIKVLNGDEFTDFTLNPEA